MANEARHDNHPTPRDISHWASDADKALKLRIGVSVMPLVVAPTTPARDVKGRLEAPPAPRRMERRSWVLLMIMMNNEVSVYGTGI